jgi:hypothetical protein
MGVVVVTVTIKSMHTGQGVDYLLRPVLGEHGLGVELHALQRKEGCGAARPSPPVAQPVPSRSR